MGLKSDYFQGSTGLLAQMDNAFAAGIAYVGSANVQIANLSFGNVGGAALEVADQVIFAVSSANATAGAVYSNNGQMFTVSSTIVAGTTLMTTSPGLPTASGTLTKVSGSGDATIMFSSATNPAAPGLYFDISSTNVNFRVWFQVDAEVAPSAGSSTLVQVNVLNTDTPIQVASKAAAAMNLITGQPISAEAVNEVLVMTNTLVGPGLTAPDNGTLGGTSSMTLIQAGSVASGNYAALQAGLVAGAAAGLTHFTVTLPVSYLPQFLRGQQGKNCWPNNQINPNVSQVTMSNTNYGNDPSDNLIRKSFFAGILQGLADNQIYNFECNLVLNTYDQLNLAVDFNFTFQTK